MGPNNFKPVKETTFRRLVWVILLASATLIPDSQFANGAQPEVGVTFKDCQADGGGVVSDQKPRKCPTGEVLLGEVIDARCPCICCLKLSTSSPTLPIILPHRVILLPQPITIAPPLYYKDGGSIGLEIHDSHSTVFKFCIPSGIYKAPPRIHLNTLKPDDPSAEMIPIGGIEEKSILTALQAWADSKLSPKEQSALLDNPNGVSYLSQDDRNTYWILGAINRLQYRQLHHP